MTQQPTQQVAPDKKVVAERPRCTCGAIDYAICFCEINISDFLATDSRRRA
jgi:hypothetical protein